MSSEIYEQLLAEIDEELHRRVFKALAEVPGERVTRPQMVLKVFGVYVRQEQLASSKEDRKIRKCIEDLQRRGLPILASSGEAGYWLENDPAKIEEYIRELESRRERMAEKIRSLRRAKQVAGQITWKGKPVTVVQQSLF